MTSEAIAAVYLLVHWTTGQRTTILLRTVNVVTHDQITDDGFSVLTHGSNPLHRMFFFRLDVAAS